MPEIINAHRYGMTPITHDEATLIRGGGLFAEGIAWLLGFIAGVGNPMPSQDEMDDACATYGGSLCAAGM